eukprot:UN01228
MLPANFYLYRTITFYGYLFQDILIVITERLAFSVFARRYWRNLG